MKKQKNTKKRILAGVVTLALAGGVYNIAAAAVDELVIVSWGGAYSTSQQKAYHEPYMKKTGINIVNDDSSPEAVAKLRAMNETGNISWDLVDVTAGSSIRLCDEGLALPIKFNQQLAEGTDGSQPTDDFGDLLINDCFIPQIVYSTTFGYRTNVAAWGGKVPTTIKDVFDVEKFPGKRSLEKRPVNNLEWALLADGVPVDEVYDMLSTEEGLERAFAKLDIIKDHTIWWTSSAETPQRLADEEIVIGSAYNGRLFSLIEEKKQKQVAMLWDWQAFDLDGWVVPVGLPPEREKAVFDYLYFATDTQRLADQAKYISYGPARKSSAPLVGKHAELGIEMAPHMPTDPKNSKTKLLVNFEWWADNRDELDQRFQAWLTQ